MLLLIKALQSSKQDNSTKEIKFGKAVRHLFPHDPSLPWCNNASYGNPPLCVIEAEHRIYKKSLNNIDWWIRKGALPECRKSLKRIAQFAKVSEDDVVYVPNATYGINSVVKSLKYNKDDVVMTLSTYYWSLESQISFAKDYLGAKPVFVPIGREELADDDKIVAAISAKVQEYKDKLRLFVFDLYGSKTAVIYPAQKICKAIKEIAPDCKILIDGAHTQGNIEVDIPNLGCDFYVSSLNKWCFGPVASGMLWVKKECQNLILPACTSNYFHLSYQNSKTIDNTLTRNFFWQGTGDFSKLVALQTSFDFIEQMGGIEKIRKYNHDMVWKMGHVIAKLWGTEVLVDKKEKVGNMINVRIPGIEANAENNKIMDAVHSIMLDKGMFTNPLTMDGSYWARFSSQIFNEEEDYLITANEYLKEIRRQQQLYLKS